MRTTVYTFWIRKWSPCEYTLKDGSAPPAGDPPDAHALLATFAATSTEDAVRQRDEFMGWRHRTTDEGRVMDDDAKSGDVDYLRRPDVLDKRADAVLRHLTACARRINALRSAVGRADEADKDPLREVLSAELSYLESDLDIDVPRPEAAGPGDGDDPDDTVDPDEDDEDDEDDD